MQRKKEVKAKEAVKVLSKTVALFWKSKKMLGWEPWEHSCEQRSSDAAPSARYKVEKTLKMCSKLQSHRQGGFEGANRYPWCQSQPAQASAAPNTKVWEYAWRGARRGSCFSPSCEGQFPLVTAQSMQILFVINCSSIRKSQLALKITHPSGGRGLARLSSKTSGSCRDSSLPPSGSGFWLMWHGWKPGINPTLWWCTGCPLATVNTLVFGSVSASKPSHWVQVGNS